MDTEPHPRTLRIVLVGKTDAGKSSTGNTICGRRAFTVKSNDRGITFGSKMEMSNFNGQLLSMVDTPGLFDPSKPNEDVKKEIANGVALAAPGPHMLLVVIRPGKFTTEEQVAVNIIQGMFGEKASRYTMALFTRGDDLETDGVTIEDVIRQSSHLRTFISQCGGGYHVFNNRSKNPSQVRELLQKINSTVQRNAGSYYTDEMFRVAVEAMQEENNIETRRQEERQNLFLQTVPSPVAAGTFTAFGFTMGRRAVTIVGAVGRAFTGAVSRAAGTATEEAVALATTAERPVALAGAFEIAGPAGKALLGAVRYLGQTLTVIVRGTVGGAAVAGLTVALAVAGVGSVVARRKNK